MAGDLLGIGTSGLMAFQRSLSTISHNIANANTDGRPGDATSTGYRCRIHR